MASIKALLTGLAGVSLCMANISGIVTDTGTTPIAGAVVHLEKGGQTATTGADGSFTLVVSTAILPVNGKLFPNGLSARISGTMLNVTIAERAVVEVATFDLSGKALSTVRKTFDAGSHSLSLPYQGAGVYLYKVKSGNREFVLKCNAVGGISSGSSVTTQSSSSKPLAKHTMSTAAINDIIAATKTGYLNYRVVAYNSDTTGVQIKMIASAGTVRDTDGNVYQTVRIGNQVWMVENLRVTQYNDGSAIPLVSDSAAWDGINDSSLTTQAYCFYNNTTNSDSIKKYGALYNWYVVNTGKLAPAGWHVPTDAEWTIMENYLVLNGYNWDGTTNTSHFNKIAKSLAAKTDWFPWAAVTIGGDLTLNNRSGFSALPGGFRYSFGTFSRQRYDGYWWSATEGGSSSACSRSLHCNYEDLYRDRNYKSEGLSVRLVRD